MPKKGRPVLLTTQFNGVFFGYADDTSDAIVHLKSARLCVFWSKDTHGFMGLASHGPSKDCRIGPAADIEVRQVTSVTEVTPEAVKRWESMPWV